MGCSEIVLAERSIICPNTTDYVQTQRIFTSRDEAVQLRKSLDCATELYESNRSIYDEGDFRTSR